MYLYYLLIHLLYERIIIEIIELNYKPFVIQQFLPKSKLKFIHCPNTLVARFVRDLELNPSGGLNSLSHDMERFKPLVSILDSNSIATHTGPSTLYRNFAESTYAQVQ